MTSSTIAVASAAVLLGVIVGFFLTRRRLHTGSGKLDDQTQQILSSANAEAEAIRRDASLKAKEILLKAKTEAEEKLRHRSDELKTQKTELLQQEESLEQKGDQMKVQQEELERKEHDLTQREKAAESMAQSANDMLQKARSRLESLAQMSKEEAREKLVEQMRDEAKRFAAAEIKRIEEASSIELKERSATIIATAIQRCASEYVSERTVTVVPLPGDDMKGRIIGREGRNIRVIEAATGVDLIVDDTPEAVILASFSPLRREVAKLALTRLIADGRIHPSRIEEVVSKSKSDIETACKEAGEQAVFDLGLHRVHPELVKLLGELTYRTSYTQNVLQHSIEVGFLAGAIAAELGVPVKPARRAGLLHDIGKAAPEELEGSHAAVGANLAKKYQEKGHIVHAIAAHHGEVPANSVLANIVDAANTLSAQRPGARRERLQSYVQRLHDLEHMCRSYDGVETAYALQAGREIRIIVDNASINDDMATVLSHDIARQIEHTLAYPGQIKVSVIRETRASAVAR